MTSRGSLPYDHYHHCKRLGSRDDHLPPTNVAWVDFWLSVLCGLSLLLAPALLQGVYTGLAGFPPSTKTNISKL